MTEISEILSPIINQVFKRQKYASDMWANSKYAMFKKLEIDKRGEVGEMLVEKMLADLGVTVERNRETDRTKKHWDIKDIKHNLGFEIKLATQGTHKNGKGTYQYEGFEKNRNYNGVILIAVAPNNIYITCAAKRNIPFAKESNYYTKRKKKLHHREYGTQYKWTLAASDVADREIITIQDFRTHYYKMIKDITS